MRFSTLFAEVLFATATLAQSTTQIYKFSGSPTSAENIIVRSNGQILVTFFDKGELWTIDPASKQASRVVSFNTPCSGAITEIAPDVFAVVAGDYTRAGGNKPGSWGIWKVDFTSGTASASLLKKVPESGFWNGITTLNNNTILIGDAGKGSVWSMDVNTGAYATVITDATMAPGTGIPMGIDGLRYKNGTLYYTNVSKNTFHKVPVDATGKMTGAITTIWSNTFSDDLCIGPDDSVYVATGSANKIQKMAADGKISTAASVSGATSCTLGRTEGDTNTLYVATGSGAIASVKV